MISRTIDGRDCRGEVVREITHPTAGSVLWKKIRAGFARHCLATGGVTPNKARKGEKGIWQRRFWEHAIRDEVDFRAHAEYGWFNPVKPRLVEQPGDWPFLSVHRDRKVGATNAAG